MKIKPPEIVSVQYNIIIIKGLRYSRCYFYLFLYINFHVVAIEDASDGPYPLRSSRRTISIFDFTLSPSTTISAYTEGSYPYAYPFKNDTLTFK